MIKITSQTKKIIENNPLALATANKKGEPHVIAVGDVKVISENQLLVGDNYMKITIENIKNNHNVSLVVWDKENGISLNGAVDYYTSGEYLEEVKRIHKGYPAKGALLITVSKLIKLH